VFDFAIQGLIIASLVCFSIETIPGISDSTRNMLRAIEIGTVGIFTLEYSARVIVADNRLSFIFSFYGVIDLLAVLPFYVSTGLDLRSIRALRLLRIFRILKLVRYSKAMQRFAMAFRIAREELLLFLFVTLILFYLSAVGIYYFEHDVQPNEFSSVFSSLWWAVITLTTVGYGDVYPVTIGGRVFTTLILLLGLGIVAVPAGIISSALGKARADGHESC
jgi:voltage-gated potassium channel